MWNTYQSDYDFFYQKAKCTLLCPLYGPKDCFHYFQEYMDSLVHKILKLKLSKHLFQVENYKWKLFSGVTFPGTLHLDLVLPIFHNSYKCNTIFKNYKTILYAYNYIILYIIYTSKKVKYKLIIRLGNTVHNSQKFRTIQISTNWWIDMVCLYNVILVRNKSKFTIDTWSNMNEPWKHYANWKKPDPEDACFIIPCISKISRKRSFWRW